MNVKNKWKLYAYINDKWLYVHSYLTKKKAEEGRRLYNRQHTHNTRIVVIPIDRHVYGEGK